MTQEAMALLEQARQLIEKAGELTGTDPAVSAAYIRIHGATADMVPEGAAWEDHPGRAECAAFSAAKTRAGGVETIYFVRPARGAK